MGTAPESGRQDHYLRLGGAVAAKLGKARQARFLFDFVAAPEDLARAAADFALGLRLRAYKFDQFKTKKSKKKIRSRPVRSTSVSPAQIQQR